MDIYNIAEQMKRERKTIFDLNINVTFYARVSTLREEQESSIESQINYFTNLIQNNSNWNYVEGYVDMIRGESAENRAEFMRMIEDGKNGKFDLILTKEVSRFARNTIDSLTYTRDLLRAGVGVFFQNDNICTIDTDSELRLTIMSSIAADEVRKLSERIRWGHKRAIEKGRVVGNSRIFGYKKHDCKLEIDESEAEMVKLIFDLYATGDYSTRKIENILYERGYRGRKGTRIHHNTISGIIQNPKYKGYYCGNKVRIVDYRTKEQKFLPKEEWVMYKDETGETVPAIVSEKVWDKCNKIFEERSQAVKARGRSFKDNSVLSGKIWCTVHNKPYWRTSYSNKRSKGLSVFTWLCSEKKRFGAKACDSFSILESEIYEILSSIFNKISFNLKEYISTFIEVYKQSEIEGGMQKQINTLKAKLEREKNKQNKILELYTDGDITKQEFTRMNTDCSTLITNLENEIRELKEQVEKNKNHFNSIKAIEEYFTNMYTDTNYPINKVYLDEMIKTIVEGIYITPVSKTEMKIVIKLATGDNDEISYNKDAKKNSLHLGLMSLEMCPNYRFDYIRINRRTNGHKIDISYNVILMA